MKQQEPLPVQFTPAFRGPMGENEWLTGCLDAVIESEETNMHPYETENALNDMSKVERLKALKRKHDSGLASRFFLKELLSESSVFDLHPIWQTVLIISLLFFLL